MKVRYTLLIILVALLGFNACNDEAQYTSSTSNVLSFQTDSIHFDTLFSGMPSPTKSFWVYNHSEQSIKCTNIRLQRGNQTGFRVNVDGVYLGKKQGYQASDIEIRKEDSLRVYVEVTSPKNYLHAPKLVEDQLLFTLESGIVQKLNLQVYSLDAVVLNNLHVLKDTTIASNSPIVVNGTIKVDSAATLTIQAGTTLYFEHGSGIDVYGRLVIEGTADKNVTLRGNRLDKMFAYLPYDRLSGQWQGVHYYNSSFDNTLTYVDIHGPFDAITIDSTNVARQTLYIEASTIHNCQGYGLHSTHAQWSAVNTIFSNTLHDCVFVDGGKASLFSCSLCQFYPFDANRGVALHFSATHSPILNLYCTNTLITGYNNNEVMRTLGKSPNDLQFSFISCLLRTPKELTADSIRFKDVIFEHIQDTLVAGSKNFRKVDTDSLKYDFRLSKLSLSLNKAKKDLSPKADRLGNQRDNTPDIGAYEYFKTKNKHEKD